VRGQQTDEKREDITGEGLIQLFSAYFRGNSRLCGESELSCGFNEFL
jgi:hypothetical protein